MKNIGYLLVPCNPRERIIEGVTHNLYIVEKKKKGELEILSIPNQLLYYLEVEGIRHKFFTEINNNEEKILYILVNVPHIGNYDFGICCGNLFENTDLEYVLSEISKDLVFTPLNVNMTKDKRMLFDMSEFFQGKI